MSREVNEPVEHSVGPAGAVDPAENGESSNWLVSRRQVLGGSVGLGVGSLLVKYDPNLHEPDQLRNVIINDNPEAVVVITPAVPKVHFTLERPEDMVLLDITFCGFTLIKGTKYPSLKATTAKTISNWIGVIVQFPPQHIGEGDYAEPQPQKPIPEPLLFDPTPVVSQMAGPSRLCFTMKTGDTIPLPTGNVSDLLDWSGWNLSVPRGATSGSGIQNPLVPAVYETAIEAPILLYLSPVVYPGTNITKGIVSTKFVSRNKPFTQPKTNVTELWTANLVSTYSVLTGKGLQVSSLTPSIAAPWCIDYNTASPGQTPESYIIYDMYVAPPA
jgi:hypothetical protein